MKQFHLFTFNARHVSLFRVSVMGCSGEGELCWWWDVLHGANVILKESVDVGEACVFSVNPLRGTQNPDRCLVTTSVATMWTVDPNFSEVSANYFYM